MAATRTRGTPGGQAGPQDRCTAERQCARLAAVPKSFARTRRTLALGHHLVLLVAIAIVPLLAFAGWIIHDVGREQRRRVEYGLRTTARALAIAVEREILATQ